MAKGTSIAPSSFSEDAGLLDMSMEDVVGLFLDREKKRYRETKDDENQQEVIISAKVIPMGLLAILESTAHKLAVSRSLLTKCLSHQVASWFDNLPHLKELADTYYSAYDSAIRVGRPDLCSRFRNDTGYSLLRPSTDTPTTFRSIRWVQSKLSMVSTPLGISTSTLFSIGLCWSATQSTNEDYKTIIDNMIRQETRNLERYCGARFIRIRAFREEVAFYELES